MRIRALLWLAACGVVIISVPSFAGQDSSRKAKDPNEKVCEKITVVGSRLATRRVCATRAEWAESRRLDRDAIDLWQRSPCVIAGTSAKGRPSC